MSSRELIESLRKSGEEKVRLIMLEAEQQAASARAEAERNLQDLRRTCAAKLAGMAEEAERLAAADAGIRARTFRLTMEQEAGARLYACSLKLLPRLRHADYPGNFLKLAAELPHLPWTSVRVNPEDAGLAKSCFPDAEIIPTETISGGLDAATRDGAIRVVNTFEKRLERAWKDLLPKMISEVEREANHGASPHT